MNPEFELTADDYADAQRAHLRRMLGWKIAFAYLFAIIFMLGIIISIFDSRYFEQMKPLWFLGALVTLLVALTETGFLYRRQFRKLKALQLPVTMQVDHDSVLLSSDRGKGGPSGLAMKSGRSHDEYFFCTSNRDYSISFPSMVSDRKELRLSHNFCEKRFTDNRTQPRRLCHSINDAPTLRTVVQASPEQR